MKIKINENCMHFFNYFDLHLDFRQFLDFWQLFLLLVSSSE